MYINNTPDTTAIRNILKGLRVIFRMTPAVLIAPWISCCVVWFDLVFAVFFIFV